MSYTGRTRTGRRFTGTLGGQENLGEVAEEGGSIPGSRSKVLPIRGPGDASFRAETWVLTEMMLQKMEGVHVSFLRKVTGMSVSKLGVDTWKKEEAERVLQATGKKCLGIH